MKKRIFRSISILVIFAALLTAGVLSIVFYQNTLRDMEVSVKSECGYIALAVESSGQEYLTSTVAGVSPSRITLISKDGTILYDSAVTEERLDNHGDRPEIIEAFRDGEGSEVRFSDTLSKQTFYYAMKLSNGDVIRVARTIGTVFSSFRSQVLVFVVPILVIALLAIYMVNRMVKKIMEPINQLDLDHPTENHIYDEFGPLLLRIDKQNNRIKKQVKELKRSEEEYFAITEHMKDGLIVTGRKKVLSINQSALYIFHTTKEKCVGHDIITVSRNVTLRNAFAKALDGKADEQTLILDGRTYKITSTPVYIKKDRVAGSVIMLVDETDKSKAEEIRREFTANVSHELKTPLMSISGYAELLMNDMVKEGDIREFAGRIYREAKRLSTLVEDIIELSMLDEGSIEKDAGELDLYTAAEAARENLLPAARQHGVTLILEGEHQKICGVSKVIYDIIYNLADNAVKYNKEGGTVTLLVGKNKGGGPFIKVRDDGIGIPNAEQERVFERFYRVDKSHSKDTGGTGLGLSIVKHGAALHNAKIHIDSEEGSGTEITIEFPLTNA